MNTIYLRSMKTLNDLLLLGDPRLYEVCEPIVESELPLVGDWAADMDVSCSTVISYIVMASPGKSQNRHNLLMATGQGLNKQYPL
jgi:hypothetical protein